MAEGKLKRAGDLNMSLENDKQTWKKFVCFCDPTVDRHDKAENTPVHMIEVSKNILMVVLFFIYLIGHMFACLNAFLKILFNISFFAILDRQGCHFFYVFEKSRFVRKKPWRWIGSWQTYKTGGENIPEEWRNTTSNDGRHPIYKPNTTPCQIEVSEEKFSSQEMGPPTSIIKS